MLYPRSDDAQLLLLHLLLLQPIHFMLIKLRSFFYTITYTIPICCSAACFIVNLFFIFFFFVLRSWDAALLWRRRLLWVRVCLSSQSVSSSSSSSFTSKYILGCIYIYMFRYYRSLVTLLQSSTSSASSASSSSIIIICIITTSLHIHPLPHNMIVHDVVQSVDIDDEGTSDLCM